MTGLFLAPATDRKGAYEHFRKTVLDGVPMELYGRYSDEDLGSAARVWGLTSSIESTWETVNEGDWVLFYTQENKYEFATRVSAKVHNPDLGDAIRGEMLEGVSEERDWDFLLFLDDPISVSVSGKEVADLLDYGNRYPVRFMRVTNERLESLKSKYGDVDGFIDAVRE